MAKSKDPDEMAYYEWSHLDLHCLCRYLFWSAGLKWFSYMCNEIVIYDNAAAVGTRYIFYIVIEFLINTVQF